MIDRRGESEPWLAHLLPYLNQCGAFAATDWRTELTAQARTRGLASGMGRLLAFVAGDDAPDGVAYETHIATTGRVPTRDNDHDWLNALTWLALPRTKAALNRRQAEEIARLGVGNRRGLARDAATLIDESGLLLATEDPAVFDTLARRDWHALLVSRRAQWHRSIVPIAFGHALLAKLRNPYKSATAAVVALRVRGSSIAAIDAAAAAVIARPDLAPRLLEALPVLGIPDWWAANADPGFYKDVAVFRPARRVAEECV